MHPFGWSSRPKISLPLLLLRDSTHGRTRGLLFLLFPWKTLMKLSPKKSGTHPSLMPKAWTLSFLLLLSVIFWTNLPVTYVDRKLIDNPPPQITAHHNTTLPMLPSHRPLGGRRGCRVCVSLVLLSLSSYPAFPPPPGFLLRLPLSWRAWLLLALYQLHYATDPG